jgi:hypothetical protein
MAEPATPISRHHSDPDDWFAKWRGSFALRPAEHVCGFDDHQVGSPPKRCVAFDLAVIERHTDT